jgi:DNA segregation ATPase FtsK/SpoIIIE-like protein
MPSKKFRSAVAVIGLLAAFVWAAPSAAFTEVSFEFFHSSLSPYGSWQVSGSYGQVWRPYVRVEQHWHPYAYGHWVYTDFGWTWVSEYEWGGIPFHYGTWVVDPVFGWVWVPGYVWAPAWVVYRTGPSYIGWAPVPPSFSFGVSFSTFDYDPDYFVFVQDRHFCDRDIHRYVIPRERTRIVYNDTTIINNNITIDNSVVVNRGLDVHQVERVAERRPERLRIDQVPRVAPFERVSRESLRANPREALRFDPARAERGEVRVVESAPRAPRDARGREGGPEPERPAAEPGREPGGERGHRERAEPQPDRSEPGVWLDPKRAEHDRAEHDRAAQRDRERAVQQDQERAQHEQRGRDQQRMQQERDDRDHARQQEQDRAARQQQEGAQREEQRARQEQQRMERDQERAQQQQREVEQERSRHEQRAREQQMQQERSTQREQERATRQQQERAQHDQERAMRQQQEQMQREQEHAARQQQEMEQRARQEQERAHGAQQQQQRRHQQEQQQQEQQQQEQQQDGTATAPDDQPHGHRGRGGG